MVSWIDKQHRVCRTTWTKPLQLLAVVMPDKHQVDTRDTFAEGTACILEIIRVIVLETRVHEYHEEVGTLTLAYQRYPNLGRGDDVIEVQPLPQMTRHPLWDGGSGEA